MPESAEHNIPQWETATLQKLLKVAFTNETLTYLCFDHFDPVFLGFHAQTSKDEKIAQLLAYCETHEQTPRLVDVLRYNAPKHYALFHPGNKEAVSVETTAAQQAMAKHLLAGLARPVLSCWLWHRPRTPFLGQRTRNTTLGQPHTPFLGQHTRNIP